MRILWIPTTWPKSKPFLNLRKGLSKDGGVTFPSYHKINKELKRFDAWYYERHDGGERIEFSTEEGYTAFLLVWG